MGGKMKRTWQDWLIIIAILLAFLLIGSGAIAFVPQLIGC